MGYNLRYILHKGSTSNHGTPSLSNGHKPQTLPSSALAEYDWFLEHVFLAPYYFMSDRAWDLFNFLKRVSDRKTNISPEASSPDNQIAAADLEEVVAQK